MPDGIRPSDPDCCGIFNELIESCLAIAIEPGPLGDPKGDCANDAAAPLQSIPEVEPGVLNMEGEFIEDGEPVAVFILFCMFSNGGLPKWFMVFWKELVCIRQSAYDNKIIIILFLCNLIHGLSSDVSFIFGFISSASNRELLTCA